MCPPEVCLQILRGVRDQVRHDEAMQVEEEHEVMHSEDERGVQATHLCRLPVVSSYRRPEFLSALRGTEGEGTQRLRPTARCTPRSTRPGTP